MKTLKTSLAGALLACGIATWPVAATYSQVNIGERVASAQEMVDALDPTPNLRSIGMQVAAPSISIQVGFDFDSDRIQPRSTAVLVNLAAALRDERLKSKRFAVTGHTDAVGSLGYNMQLSERRAAAVKSFLVGQGVDPSRLKTVGRGPTDLLNKRQPAAAENRRVEIAVSG
jgi:outer membrane protein OmpA-like peptidoglycan-associated protein